MLFILKLISPSATIETELHNRKSILPTPQHHWLMTFSTVAFSPLLLLLNTEYHQICNPHTVLCFIIEASKYQEIKLRYVIIKDME